MEASIQNLIQDSKAVVFEKDELDFRDISELTALLQFLAVAAHLRSLRSDDPPSKGHPRPIKQNLGTVPVSN